MCGPSSQEELLASQEGSLSQSLMNAYNERFKTQNDILGQVQGALGQLRSGNYPPGYSPSVMAALRTSVLSNVSGATQLARQAAANATAGQGGGAGSPLTSGIQEQIQGAIASSMAGKQSDLLNQLTLQNYDVGRENLLKSISGLQTLASSENPEAFASGASGATSDAFGMQKTINQQRNQWQADLAGLATSAVSSFAGGLGGGIGKKLSRTLSPSQLSMPQPNYTSPNYPDMAPPDITTGAGLDVLSGGGFGNSTGLSDNVG